MKLNDRQIAALDQASKPEGLVFTGCPCTIQLQNIERNTANKLHVYGLITVTASGNQYVEFGITDVGRSSMRSGEM